jgi:5'-deoxynucleotidase YfbR-like HD superfamily hydrolase
VCTVIGVRTLTVANFHSSVGDITPLEGVPSHVKFELEEQAMKSFLNEMLSGDGNAQARDRFRSLWYEYEARETPEAKLVKDLDRLELIVQAVEYEKCRWTLRRIVVDLSQRRTFVPSRLSTPARSVSVQLAFRVMF